MFCPNCGSKLADGSRFCPFCGASAALEQALITPAPERPRVEAPRSMSRPVPPQRANQNLAPVRTGPLEDPRGMKWFKFIIYFQLFANAAINFLSAVSSFTGLLAPQFAFSDYALYPGLRWVDLLYGVFCLALAVFAIIARQRLAGFRRGGPMLYYCLMLAGVVFSVIYLALRGAAMQASLLDMLDLGTVVSLLTGLVMLLVNWIYFTRRADLFVN